MVCQWVGRAAEAGRDWGEDYLTRDYPRVRRPYALPRRQHTQLCVVRLLVIGPDSLTALSALPHPHVVR